MTELTFSEADWTMDAAGTWLRIKADVPYKAQMFLEHMIPGKKYVAEIKEFRKKRSLDSNNYFWQLCDQIAGKLGRTKEDLYVEYIKVSACSRTSISPATRPRHSGRHGQCSGQAGRPRKWTTSRTETTL